MDKQRVDTIAKVAESLAAYVDEFDERFLRDFYWVQQYDGFRKLLLKAINHTSRQNKPPLIRYRDFCTAFFEENGETLRPDWRLARDLAFIRMIEWLYDRNKLAQPMAILSEAPERDETPFEDEIQ